MKLTSEYLWVPSYDFQEEHTSGLERSKMDNPDMRRIHRNPRNRSLPDFMLLSHIHRKNEFNAEASVTSLCSHHLRLDLSM